MIRRLCFNNGSLSNHSTSETESDESFVDAKDQTLYWTNIEDGRLQCLIGTHGDQDWKIVSSYFADKTASQCRERWNELLRSVPQVMPWAAEEDRVIVDLVHRYGPNHWSFVSKHLPRRSIKQCRERWFEYLSHTSAQLKERTKDSDIEWCSSYSVDNEPPIKKRMEYVSPPFASYSGNSRPVFFDAQLPDYKMSRNPTVEQKRKTVYPDSSAYTGCTPSNHCFGIADSYSGQLPLQPAHGFHQNLKLTPIKFSSINQGSYDHARIDGESLRHAQKSGLIPLTSAAFRPGILRRKRQRSEQENRLPKIKLLPQSAFNDVNTHALSLSLFSTPIKTPVKSLPFSPSQFFNSPDGTETRQAVTSTPMCSKPCEVTQSNAAMPSSPIVSPGVRGHEALLTPSIKASLANSQSQTPTPFKKALADLEKRSGVIKTEHHTPTHIHKDLQEVIANDPGLMMPNRGSRSHYYSRHTASVQRNLEQRLSELADDSQLLVFQPETPSKTLTGDASLEFSPPYIFKDTIYTPPRHNELRTACLSPRTVQTKKSVNQLITDSLSGDSSIDFAEKSGFKMIACGKTEDQKIMTHLARRWMQHQDSLRV